MKISENLRDAIEDFVAEKSINQLQTPMLSKGLSRIEHRYNLCYNPKVSDKVFVISEIMVYQGHSLYEKTYGIYAFDKNTCKEIKAFQKSKDCYLGIVNELKLIERIL